MGVKGTSLSGGSDFRVNAVGDIITAILHPVPPVAPLTLGSESELVEWARADSLNRYMTVNWMMDGCFREYQVNNGLSATFPDGFDDKVLQLRLAGGHLASPE
jgi:hypothetical protein